MHSKILLAAVIALSLVLMSCAKLDDNSEGPLQYMDSKFTDGIAKDLGRLVAVTTHQSESNAAALWFEKDDGTISVVWVNVVKKSIHKKVLTIPRK